MGKTIAELERNNNESWAIIEHLMHQQGRKWTYLAAKLVLSDNTLRVMKKQRRPLTPDQKSIIAAALEVEPQAIWRPAKVS